MSVGLHSAQRTCTLLLGSVLAFLVSILLLLPPIGWFLVYEVSEAREGSVTMEILRSGEFILPLRLGSIVPSKPPLFHWINAAAASLRSSYDETSLRLPSVLFAGACASTLFYLAASLSGFETGALAAGILLTTNGFLRLATDGRVDMVFCFFVSLSIISWLHTQAASFVGTGRLKRSHSGENLIPAVCAGLAVLCKGPLGFILPLLVISAIAFAEERWDGLRSVLRREWLLGLLIPMPWYLLAIMGSGEAFIDRQIVFENFSRFIGGKGINNKPPWFYLETFWLHGAPWSFIGGALLIAAVTRWRAVQLWFEHLRPAERFLFRGAVIWFFLPVVFLSFASGKRTAYLLPTLIPLALLIALVLTVFLRCRRPSDFPFTLLSRLGFFAWGVTVVGGAIAFTLIFSEVVRGTLASLPIVPFLRDAQSALRDVRGEVMLYGGALSLASFGFWWLGITRKEVTWLAAGIFAYLHIPFSLYVNVATVYRGYTHSLRDLAYAVSSLVPARDPLIVVKRVEDESLDTFFFYYRRPVILVSPPYLPPLGGYSLIRNDGLACLEPEELLTLERMYVGGRAHAPEPWNQWTLVRDREPPLCLNDRFPPFSLPLAGHHSPEFGLRPQGVQ